LHSNYGQPLLEHDIAKRIFIRVKTESLVSQDYRASANRVVSEGFPDWENDPRVLFVAIDVWSERTFIVIDINHHDYDFGTAHKAKTVFPVFVLRQYGKSRTGF
jgi:hypothetical protein